MWIALIVAFVPACLVGWLFDAWAPAIVAGVVAFLLLWPLASIVQTGVDRLVGWTSTALTLPPHP